jgi:hypothetical protein
MDFFSFRAASLSIPLFLKFQLLNIYYWTASGVVKPSPSMGFRGQPSLIEKETLAMFHMSTASGRELPV